MISFSSSLQRVGQEMFFPKDFYGNLTTLILTITIGFVRPMKSLNTLNSIHISHALRQWSLNSNYLDAFLLHTYYGNVLDKASQ